MIHLLIIGAVWPEPNSSAAGSRMLQLIALFQQRGWRITFASAAAASPHAIDLAAQAVTTAAITLNDPSFDQFMRDLQPDVVLFDRFMTEEQFGWRVTEQCPNALRVLNTEDLHCLRKARHTVVKAGRGDWGSVAIDPADLITDSAKREVAAIVRSDLSIMISEAEIALLTTRFQVDASLLHYTPFMLQATVPDWPDYSERQHFVTIGNFRHAPNWDAVLQLKQVVWPLMRDRVGAAELHVYGAYPPAKATALTKASERFYVRGWAADAADVMRQARVCLAPLRFGAGLKGKLITAMQAGTPSVTTSIGAEGMHGEMAWAGTIAANPAAFAEAAIELYQDEAAWRKAQANGVAILNARFDQVGHGEALFGRIQTLLRTLSEHRHNNFTGAMLRHHSLQSTRYMARWIEAKNRTVSD